MSSKIYINEESSLRHVSFKKPVHLHIQKHKILAKKNLDSMSAIAPMGNVILLSAFSQVDNMWETILFFICMRQFPIVLLSPQQKKHFIQC